MPTYLLMFASYNLMKEAKLINILKPKNRKVFWFTRLIFNLLHNRMAD